MMFTFCLLDYLNPPITEFAFPKPDDDIRDYLNGEKMTEKEYSRFFHAVFKTIGSVLEEKETEIHKVSADPSKVDPQQRFATWWADHLSTQGTREGIYKRILEEINGIVGTMEIPSTLSSVPSRICHMQRTPMESLMSPDPRLPGLLRKLDREYRRTYLAERTI